MSRSLRRGALAATAIVFSIASLAACGAGNNAETLKVKPDNAATAVDTIKIQNATVITQPEPGAEGPAAISATVFNNSSTQQTLDAITLPGLKTPVKLSPAQGSGPITVPAQGSVILGGAGNASAVVEGGREASENTGGVQEVVFRFSETGDVKLQALVVPAESYFTGYGPSSVPKPPTPEGEASATPSGTPSESATGHAGAPGEPGNGESGEPGTPTDSSSASHGAGH
ncbi:DUF461 domain-containing protein [Streptomyces sp. ISL-1]|uniref:DUF461 domain-containing protein n=1 Tax=Streptomyces sp. ISL-1 TaxID=2817657 RepID=UPI001BE53198|nr:DUF461 domain-containing protein [Streptomyces sp. ISL-1]MBT2391224.1 DUF461 domain-containing protein [Streptomyces sp. ISL-1]